MKLTRVNEPATGHGVAKFPRAGVIATSARRHWSGLLVEQRSHAAGEIPAFTPSHTEITMVLGGGADACQARVIRRGNGALQDTPARPNTIWLCPAGVSEDCIRITGPLPDVLHMYLSRDQFARVAEEHGVRWSGPEQIRYEAGLNDPLIEGMARTLQKELADESAGGDILASALATGLAVRLMTRYADAPCRLPRGPAALDAARLARVVDYIDANIQYSLNLRTLAGVAALSQFHFIRAFRAATGYAPHEFVIRRRLSRARMLLRKTRLPLAEIALECGFSSQSNFSRAFARESATSPGRYRADNR